MISPRVPSISSQPPLIVITGPTASGKSGLALELAEKYGGEIICADSRTIYRGLDIGTAKPTDADRHRVPHHLLDMVDPGERFTAADFQAAANAAIEAIRSRGKIPFLVGGTGLYIDAVILNYIWPAQTYSSNQYNDMSVEELQKALQLRAIPLPSNDRNRRHLVNALQRDGTVGGADTEPSEDTIVVAITTDKDTLTARIRQRAIDMFARGIVGEAQTIATKYGWESEALSGNIYPIIRQLLRSELTQAEAIDNFVVKDRRLAKRQLTWLKRHEFIKWYSLDEARVYLETTIREVC